MLKASVFTLLCLSLGVAQAEEYCNSRFEFCITAPSSLYGQGESDAGDGQTFISRDGKVTLRAWGNWGRSEGTPSYLESYQYAAKGWAASDKQPAHVVTYRLFKPNYYVLSGLEKGQIFYQRTIRDSETGNYATFLLTYPDGWKPANKVIGELSKSFMF